jgi:hypothetical protein
MVYYWEVNEMSWACSKHGDEKCLQDLKGELGRILLKLALKKGGVSLLIGFIPFSG